MSRAWVIFHNIRGKKLIIRGVYDKNVAPGGQPSPLTSSGIKQMLTVTSEAGWSTSLAPTIRSFTGRTDVDTEREEGGWGHM